jgi:hypothetical protein
MIARRRLRPHRWGAGVSARCWMAITSDRGDVPGWVLVTIMTAGLVAGLWAVAGDLLNDLFRRAIEGAAGGP